MRKATFYLVILVFCVSCKNQEIVSAKDAIKYLNNENVLFLDVRTPHEFNIDGSIKNALLIPVNQLEKKLTMLEYYKDKKIIVYCKTGRRSKLAGAFLKKNNFKVAAMEGGFLEWEKHYSSYK